MNTYSSGNLGTAFLDNNMQSSFAGSMPQQGGMFSDMMNTMSAGVTQSYQMGNVPGTAATQNMTPQQIAAQMNVGGPMSVLPALGGNIIPQILYPIAGVWSLFSGLGSMFSLKKEAQQEIQYFDPSMLAYNKAREAEDRVVTQYNYM